MPKPKNKQFAELTCQWCNKTFTHEGIYPEGIEKYGEGGGVICPYCWRFTNPNPKYHKEKHLPKPKNEQTFIELYEKAIKEGERRFGSACDHSEIKDGVCLKCLRKVRDFYDDKEQNIFENSPKTT